MSLTFVFKSAVVATVASAEVVDFNFVPIANWEREDHMGENTDVRQHVSFDTKNRLGKGAFGTAYTAQIDGVQEPHVVKVISLTLINQKRMWKMLLDEIALNKFFTIDAPHKAVGKCTGVLFDTRDKLGHDGKRTKEGEVYIVMPLINGEELYKINSIDHNERVSEDDAKAITAQFVAALAHIHASKVLYRDIKPENCMYDVNTKQLTVIDFGLSTKLTEAKPTRRTVCGTPYYLSPEISFNYLYNGFGNRSYDYMTDVWSGGALIFEFFTSEMLFPGGPEVIVNANKHPAALKKFVDKKVQEHKLSADVATLLELMLVPEVSQRTTYNDLMSHRIIQDWMVNNVPASYQPDNFKVVVAQSEPSSQNASPTSVLDLPELLNNDPIEIQHQLIRSTNPASKLNRISKANINTQIVQKEPVVIARRSTVKVNKVKQIDDRASVSGFFGQDSIEQSQHEAPQVRETAKATVTHDFKYKRNKKDRDHAVYTLTTKKGRTITLRYSKWLKVAKALNRHMTTGLTHRSRHATFANESDSSLSNVKSAYNVLKSNTNGQWSDVRKKECDWRDIIILAWYNDWLTLAGQNKDRTNLFEAAVAAQLPKRK